MAQQTFDGSLFFARIVLALGKRQNHLSSLFFYVASLLSETEENSSFSVHTQNGAFIRWNTNTTAVRIRTTTLFEQGKNVLDDNLTPVPSNPQSDENVPVQKQKRFVQRNPTRVSGKFKVDETRRGGEETSDRFGRIRPTESVQPVRREKQRMGGTVERTEHGREPVVFRVVVGVVVVL